MVWQWVNKKTFKGGRQSEFYKCIHSLDIDTRGNFKDPGRVCPEETRHLICSQGRDKDRVGSIGLDANSDTGCVASRAVEGMLQMEITL